MLNRPMNKHKRHKKSQDPSRSPNKKKNEFGTWIYGHHASLAALSNPKRKFIRILYTKSSADELDHLIEQFPVPPEIVDRRTIETVLPPDCVHQGIAVQVSPLPFTDIGDAVSALGDSSSAVFIVLDQATDPRNIGAILRTAAAFDVNGIILPDRGSPEESGTMAKAAAGALESVPLLRVTNLVRTLDDLREHGFWSIGLDGSGENTITEMDFSGRIVLVLGAEGRGLRRLTRETCDHLTRIPISEKMESLNLSNAAAITLYEIARQNIKP